MQCREIRYPRLLLETCLLATESPCPGLFSYRCSSVANSVPFRGSSLPEGRANLTSHCGRVLSEAEIRFYQEILMRMRFLPQLFVRRGVRWSIIPAMVLIAWLLVSSAVASRLTGRARVRFEQPA